MLLAGREHRPPARVRRAFDACVADPSKAATGALPCDWEPILLEATQSSPPAVLPRLPGADLMTFLNVWNHLQESVIGTASDGLNEVARRVGIPARAARLLRYGNLREKLTAIVTLGQLQERSVWASLCTYFAGRRRLPVPRRGAGAGAHRSGSAVKHLIPLVLSRADWPPARVATLLVALGPDLVSRAAGVGGAGGAAGTGAAIDPLSGRHPRRDRHSRGTAHHPAY